MFLTQLDFFGLVAGLQTFLELHVDSRSRGRDLCMEIKILRHQHDPQLHCISSLLLLFALIMFLKEGGAKCYQISFGLLKPITQNILKLNMI